MTYKPLILPETRRAAALKRIESNIRAKHPGLSHAFYEQAARNLLNKQKA